MGFHFFYLVTATPILNTRRAICKWQAESGNLTSKEEIMSNLAAEKCPPCDEGGQALAGKALADLERELGQGWKVVKEHHLEKQFTFKDFRQALDFTNRIGEVAEQVGHHPDIYLTWGKVRVEIFTHKVNGLTKNDFVLAAKFEEKVKG